MHVDIASLSSRGQFVIPRRFRDLLRLSTGSKMVIVCDGEHLLLKPIKPPQVKAFRQLITHANEMTKQAESISKKPKRRGAK
jgi:AbrB family looped-hinge helix DNA binding protein